MKTNETWKMKEDEVGLLTTLVILELIIFPMWGQGRGKYAGGIAMVTVGFLGLLAYFFLFGKRLRARGQLKTVAITIVASAVAGAAVAIGLLLLTRGLKS